MKKSILAILLAICLLLPVVGYSKTGAERMLQGIVGGSVAGAAPQAADYFGYNQIGLSSYIDGTPRWEKNKGYSTGYICPGTGTRTVDMLEQYSSGYYGTYAVKIALYTTGDMLVCQTNNFNVTEATPAWYGAAPNAVCHCTGGTSYRLAMSSYNTYMYYNSGSSGDSGIGTDDYVTAAFPGSIGAGADNDSIFSMRAHVAAIP